MGFSPEGHSKRSFLAVAEGGTALGVGTGNNGFRDNLAYLGGNSGPGPVHKNSLTPIQRSRFVSFRYAPRQIRLLEDPRKVNYVNLAPQTTESRKTEKFPLGSDPNMKCKQSLTAKANPTKL